MFSDDEVYVEIVELFAVKLQPHYTDMDIELEVIYGEEDCECTSEMGDQTVTEKWKEHPLLDFSILNIHTPSWVNSEEDPIEVDPLKLTMEDLKLIKSMIPEYIP